MRKWLVRSGWFAALGIALAGCATGSTVNPSTSTPGSSTSTTNLTSTAGAAYQTAFNTMNTAFNADIPAQNGSDPTAMAAAINNEVTVMQTFDTAVQAIQFPTGDQADVQTLLNADTALEGALGTLAANTNSTANYNAIFDTVQPDQTAATAAQHALARDLGLTFSSSG